MCTEVYRHQHIETGGNLFGLWTTSGNAVVHVAVGPGKDCKRTDTSFHQDLKYMQRVGGFLNDKFMLCHIGEWHSHHQLSLNEPSTGDKRTIKKHYPQGMKTFLVIIGNIVARDQISLSPYFFTDNGSTFEKGKLEVLEVDSPFTADSTIAEELRLGAENQPSVSMQRTTTNTNTRQPAQREQPRGSAPSQKTPLINDHQASYNNTAGVKAEDGDASIVRIPPRDYDAGSPSPEAARTSSSDQGRSAWSQSAEHTPGYRNGSPTNFSSTNLMEIDENEKPTRQEVILKRLKDEIESKFCDSEIDIVRSTSGDIEMKFKHNRNYWLIKFPQSFPEKPATIYKSYLDDYSFPSKCTSFATQSLNNHINILLRLAEECSLSCIQCKKITIQNLTHSDSDMSLFLTEEGFAIVNELCHKIKMTFADLGSFEKKISDDTDFQRNPALIISFTHHLYSWIIEFTSAFPTAPAIIKHKSERGHVYTRVYLTEYAYNPHGSRGLDSVSNILLAIKKKCSCHDCRT